MSSSPPRPFLKVSGQNRGGPPSTSSVSTSRHVVPSTQPRCSPSRQGKLYPSSQVEESPATVTPRLDKFALRILHCHNESTGAGPDRPWASTVSHDANVPSRLEDAHTSSYRGSYYESLLS